MRENDFLKPTAKIHEREENEANVSKMLTAGSSLYYSCNFSLSLKL